VAKKGKKTKKGGGKYYILTARLLTKEMPAVRREAKSEGLSVSALVRNRVLGKYGSEIRNAATPVRAKVKKTPKRATRKTIAQTTAADVAEARGE